MYEQMDTEKVLNIAERMEALVAELRAAVVATPENVKTDTIGRLAVVSTDAVIIEHEGLKLKHVDREAREGDYIRYSESPHEDTRANVFYKIINSKGKYKDDTGRILFPSLWGEASKPPEVFEVIDVQAEKLPFPKVELTANQKRAKLIENAKKFVEEHAVTSHIVEFIVNRKKRTVVVLIKEYETGKVVARGIAKCAPGDVFNQWIGKAIALAKAIEIGVPNEFFEAVQPNKIVAGMIIEYKDGRIAEVINNSYASPIDVDAQTYLSTAREYEYHARIIDDTNAKYDEVI